VTRILRNRHGCRTAFFRRTGVALGRGDKRVRHVSDGLFAFGRRSAPHRKARTGQNLVEGQGIAPFGAFVGRSDISVSSAADVTRGNNAFRDDLILVARSSAESATFTRAS
jgi:hypothetical protein